MKPLEMDEERLKAVIGEIVSARVADETKAMKRLVESALDTLEFYQKMTNMKFGAMLGNMTKKEKAASQPQEVPVFESADLNEAIRVASEIKSKRTGNGKEGSSVKASVRT